MNDTQKIKTLLPFPLIETDHLILMTNYVNKLKIENYQAFNKKI